MSYLNSSQLHATSICSFDTYDLQFAMNDFLLIIWGRLTPLSNPCANIHLSTFLR
jgi:hypothetical protein